MANLKIRDIRSSAESKGPQDGTAEKEIHNGETKIDNCPADGRPVPYPTSGPCYQPGSSLGARQHKKYTGGTKA